MAEVTTHELVVKNPAGHVVATRRGDFEDEDDPHGVNRDEADDQLERLGYLVGVFRWQSHGSYYRAVVTPVEAYKAQEARRAAQRR
jgi:hypothetical protein